MKKLFSIVLVAAGMFMSANANAAVVTDDAALREAIAPGASIQLGGSALDFELLSNLTINVEGEVTLDLNGHNLVANWPEATGTGYACYMIRLTKGTLNIVNTRPATGGEINNKTEANASYKNTKGKEIVCIGVEGYKEPGTSKEDQYSVLNISSEVTVTTQGKVGVIINAYNYNSSVTGDLWNSCRGSFGAVVTVAGKVHGEKYGMQVSGNVNAGLAVLKEKGVENAENFNYPIINIESTADVSANPTVMENGNGLYCGGYAVVNIKGYVHGSNGVYIKSGDVTIKDAVIVSENNTFTPSDGKKSGTGGSGNAIVIESNAGYPGGSTVTISGDSKIEAAGGYAIQETITTAGESKVDGVTIEGGTFKGGTQGGMIYSEETKGDGSVVITDGNMQNFKPGETEGILSGDNFIVTTEDGTIVVCSGSEPSWTSGDLADGGADYKWTSEKTQDINSNISVGFFDMEKGAVNVKAGKTLTVNRLVMGTTAKIVVEVGARLIVDGNMGIVANQAENITIQAQENNMGQFLFNPAVNSNRHPMATVVFNSKAFNKTELVQFFACPMIARGVESITSSNNAYESRFKIWNGFDWVPVGSIGSVVNIDYSKFDTPFAICTVMGTNPSTDLLSYTFKGQLLGNTQPEGFKIYKGWSEAGNSWTGDANPTAMVAELASLGCNPAVYTYQQQGNTIVWNGHDQDLDAIQKVEPMQPLLFHNETGSTIAHDIMNYEELVWNFRNPAPTAPARNLDITKAAIRIAAANGVADRVVVAEADKNSIEKYPNEAIRVYASADKEYDIFAAANLQNTYVGFNCAEAGTYTVSFDGIQGDNLVLVDLVNNREIAIVEGAEYQFEAKANTINPAHFQVRKVAEVATNVENAAVQNDVIKTIVNDQVVIIRNGVRYNTVGQRL